MKIESLTNIDRTVPLTTMAGTIITWA